MKIMLADDLLGSMEYHKLLFSHYTSKVQGLEDTFMAFSHDGQENKLFDSLSL